MAYTKTPPAEPDLWERLRKPFDPKAVGLLPKISCFGCSDALKKRTGRSCSKHRAEKCDECGAYMTNGHIHLDFVGHAAVTDRLNTAAGPENWMWEPLSFDTNGFPRLDAQGNLWIKLSIREPTKEWVTRLGYGDGSNSMKELIGDALRNAAMRFGVALDLWTKDELESTIADPALANHKPSKEQSAKSTADAKKPVTDAQRMTIFNLLKKKGISRDEMEAFLELDYDIEEVRALSVSEADNLIEALGSAQ